MYKKDNLQELLEKHNYTNIDFTDKNVLVRSCLNVILDDNGKIVDNTRLKEALPLIRELIVKARRVIIVGHLGRPKGKDRKLSFADVAVKLNEQIQDLKYDGKNFEVQLVNGPEFVKHYVKDIETHKVVLIENIRFNPEEDSDDENERNVLANNLASIADVFINDSFPDYRKSASTYDVAKLSPSYIGPTFYKEVKEIAKLNNPEKPFVAILGGAKLSEKLDAMYALLEIADKVLVGGAMAYTLLKAKGFEIGKSLYEENKIEVAKEILNKYESKLILPCDHLISDEFAEPMESIYTNDANIPAEKVAIDIGTKTMRLFSDTLKKARTIMINGPMGVFEWQRSSKGTYYVYDCVTQNKDAYKIAGGGDTISAINHFNISGFNHISTGGGAMLAFLAYDEFPTLDVIIDQNI